MGLDNTSPLLAKSGERIPESLTGVRVSSVLFRNIYATGNPNEYKGVFQIIFDLAQDLNDIIQNLFRIKRF